MNGGSPEYVQGSFSQADVVRVHRVKQKLEQLRPLVVTVVIYMRRQRLFVLITSLTASTFYKINKSFTNEVAAELGRDVADLLADGRRGLLLDAGQQLCLDGRLHLQGQARVDLLEGRRQQPPQQHRRHLFDLRGTKESSQTWNRKVHTRAQFGLIWEIYNSQEHEALTV